MRDIEREHERERKTQRQREIKRQTERESLSTDLNIYMGGGFRERSPEL